MFMGVAWLVEVCGHWFVQLLCCDVGLVAIQPNTLGILCLSHVLHVTLVTADNVHNVFFFGLHVNWFVMVYLLSVVLLLIKVLVHFMSWQVLHHLLLQGALSPGVGGVCVFTSARTRRSCRLGGLL